ncbi:MAG: (Fe-S)-binding protein, partial [Candidatus Eremiobacteraeota bacterium]|nr:(Fe-S)-binding protein [Candidatus Eremiobacteraeota bacterium]
VRTGLPADRVSNLPERIKFFILYVLGQKRLVNDPFAGILHILFFWGFILLNLVVVTDMISGLFPSVEDALRGTALSTWLFIINDVVALLVIFAVLAAFIRRFIIRDPRLERNFESAFILGLIFVIVACDLITGGLKVLLEIIPLPNLAFGSKAVAIALDTGMLTESGEYTLLTVTWWVHLFTILIFLVYLPISKHSHIFCAPFNVFFSNLEPRGRMSTPDLENSETFGISKLTQFTWKDLFDSYACSHCGRCESVCPAYLTGKPLSPTKLIENLKKLFLEYQPYLLKKTEKEPNYTLIGDVISEDAIWACTTCSACLEHCPIFIEQMPKILDMRRYLVLMKSQFPQEMVLTYKNLENNSNPWGIGSATRTDWAKDLDVKTISEKPDAEYLYWVGCAGAFDDRNKKVAKAMVNILNKAGIDFAILGTDEACCGDPARRTGNEYLYQILAQANVELLNSLGIKKIITTCPHCYNTLKNEYSEFGGNYDVYHAANFIHELISSGKIKIKNKQKDSVTYHDSCYLGRYNGIYEPPRNILKKLGTKIKEMPNNRKFGFCCGAGGGRMWMEETIGQRINSTRATEALEVKPDRIITACPYCLTMFEDAMKELDNETPVLDITEVVITAIDESAPALQKNG